MTGGVNFFIDRHGGGGLLQFGSIYFNLFIFTGVFGGGGGVGLEDGEQVLLVCAFFGEVEFSAALFPLPAFPGDLDVAGVVGAVLEAAKFGGEFLEFLPAFLGIFDCFQFLDLAGEFDGGEARDAVTEETIDFLFFQIAGVFDHQADLVLVVLMLEPVKVAARSPMREVGFADGMAVEIVLKDGLNLGKAVQPFEKVGTGPAVFEAAVEFFADCFGETSDFAVACVHNFNRGLRG